MLNGVKLKSLYSKLQTQLFNMIPEKWNRIYLYAAIFKENEEKKGEMFFYYYPTGILKKNPVNVYEVPIKFNIDEDAYMKLVNNLYETIKLLQKEFEKANEKLWTSLTVSIENLKFKIEYDYEDLMSYTEEERHMIWQYKYLGLTPERLPRKERKVLEDYIAGNEIVGNDTKEHSENMYQKHLHNNIEYDRQEIVDSGDSYAKKKIDKYELYKQQQELKKQKEIRENEIREEKIERKNQILNF